MDQQAWMDQNPEKEASEEAPDTLVEGDEIPSELEWEMIQDEGSPSPDDRLSEAPVSSRDVAPYDPLQHYLVEIRKYPFLTREEEIRLAVDYREHGNLEAVSKLVLTNLRLVVHLARDYQYIHLPLMDLVQEGNVGLMQAVKKFDPNRGVRLSSYAAWWIRAYILRYILNNWRQVRVGTTQAQRKLFFNLKKEKERLEAMGYEDVGPKLLAHELGVKESEVIEMQQRLGAPDLSLSEPRHEDSEETVGDSIPSLDLPIDEKLAKEEMEELLRRKIFEYSKDLSPRDMDFLQNRILAETPKSLAEIGRSYGISRERARQIEERMIKKLREFLMKEIKDLSVLD
jgi:RNA polymerase sigma-32 factor